MFVIAQDLLKHSVFDLVFKKQSEFKNLCVCKYFQSKLFGKLWLIYSGTKIYPNPPHNIFDQKVLTLTIFIILNPFAYYTENRP